MDGTKALIDYQRAAERLLVALAHHAEQCARRKVPARPVAAIRLCGCIFDKSVSAPWQRETKRRRVRDAAEVARRLLAAQAAGAPCPSAQGSQLIGTGAGYLLDANPRVVRWYAAQRRRAGLASLRASGQTQRIARAAGQQSLFVTEPSARDI